MHTRPESDRAISDGTATEETSEAAAVSADATWLTAVVAEAAPVASSGDTVKEAVSIAG